MISKHKKELHDILELIWDISRQYPDMTFDDWYYMTKCREEILIKRLKKATSVL